MVAAGLAAAAVAGGLLLRRSAKEEKDGEPTAADSPSVMRERRQLNAATSMLAISVLLDSALEHYRGSFKNPGMYAPLLVSAGVAASAAPAVLNPVPSSTSRTLLLSSAAAIGGGGIGFHIYNIVKRPGGFGWLNLFYAAPLGAPAALLLSGIVGLAADQVAERDGPIELIGFPPGQALAGLAAGGIMGTVSEAGLLHFRGAFQNPFMYVPVTVPPAAAAVLAAAAWTNSESLKLGARYLLLTSAAVGLAGVVFHSYGISRAMGGWRNWSQNVLDGPPLPAPPAFAALALVGLAALSLMDAGNADTKAAQ